MRGGACLCPSIIENDFTYRHRRRIKTDEKAKVVAVVWETYIHTVYAAYTI